MESTDNPVTAEIRRQLFTLRDETYRAFNAKLIPTVDPERVIGVRTPALRSYAKALSKTEAGAEFLSTLPHFYFEENQLHAFLLAEIKDFDRCVAGVDAFLPYVDNWATCDQLSPKVFAKRPEALLPHCKRWLASEETYTKRFGIGMLMQHFLGPHFSPDLLALVGEIRSDEYYVNMMAAWYFATALAKQYAAALPWLEERRLQKWTHNKTIQKAVESCRITPEQKAYLKTLKVK